MADLSESQASQSVKVVGADASAIETNYLTVETDGSVKSRLLDGAGSSVTVGQKAMSASLPVVISSDQSSVATHTSTTAGVSVTSVAASVTSVRLLNSNSNRAGVTVYNDGSSRARIKMGSTASSTSFTVLLDSNDYWEMPIGGKVYTGVIDAIWEGASGSARVTEW